MQFSFCCTIFCFNRAGLSAEQITYKWLNSFIRVLNIGSQDSWKIKRGEMGGGRERKGDEGRCSSFTWRILNYARENFWVTRWREGKLNRMNMYIRVHNKWMEHFQMLSLLIDLSCPRFSPAASNDILNFLANASWIFKMTFQRAFWIKHCSKVTQTSYLGST